MLARSSNDIYVLGSTRFGQVIDVDGVLAGIEQTEDTDILSLRGSKVVQDWVRNFNAVPVWHPKLGFVHSGFVIGMDDVFGVTRSKVGQGGRKIAITGHSLGGAHARILAAMFACAGIQVEVLCVFGSPKPGFTNLARIIQKSGMQHSSYRNRNDVVPTMPLTVEPILDFVHTEPWIEVDAAPPATDFEALRDHACALYVQALTPVPLETQH
jgi:predicted lipase